LLKHLSLLILLLFSFNLTAQADDTDIIISDDSEDVIIVEEGEEVFITVDEDEIEAEADIQTIVVTAAATETEQNTSQPQVMSVISKDEIQAGSPRNMADVLDSSAGIQVSRYGGINEPSFISLRGSSPEQVLILLDGKRLNSAQGGGVNLSSLNPDDIERIEILRGGGSSIYGENALGGVINIVTRENISSGISGNARSSYGSGQTIQAGSDISSGGDTNSFWFSLNAKKSAGTYSYQDSHSGEEQRSNADGKSAALSGKWNSHRSDSLDYGVTAGFRYDEKGVPGMLEFPSEEARMEDMAASASASLNLQLQPVLLELLQTFDYHQKNYTDPDFYTGPVDDTHRNMNGSFELTATRKDAVISLHSRYDNLYSTALEDSGGLEQKEGSLYRWQASWALRDQWQLNNLNIYPSLRYDWNYLRYDDESLRDINDAFSYNMGLKYEADFLSGLVLTANAGRAYRTPSFDDLFWPETAFAAGNPDLKSETAWVGDAGISVKPLSFLSVESSYFMQLVDNLIVWRPQASGQWSPDNVDSARIQGVEAEIRSIADLPAVNSFTEMTANMTWLDARNSTSGSINTGNYLTGRAPFMFNMLALFQHNQGHYLRLEGRYSSLRYTTDQNTKYLDAYFTSDITVNTQLKETWGLKLTLFNLFDKQYVNSEYYPVSGREFRIETVYSY